MEKKSEKFWKKLPLPPLRDPGTGLILRVVEKRVPRLSGRTLFYFSDTHFSSWTMWNRFGGNTLARWQGVDFIGSAVRKTVEQISPDWLIFGGDLCTHGVFFPDAFRLLAELKAPWKIAVPGNWDWRRRWLPFSVFARNMRNAGFQLLCNGGIVAGDIYFHGMDDCKSGYPLSPSGAIPEDTAYRIFLSHNPDNPGALSGEVLKNYRFALCGHTHGGQIRIPGYGAVRTSSKFGKKFEYGLYRHSCGTEMFVSSGIGATLFPMRFRTPPEAFVLHFI